MVLEVYDIETLKRMYLYVGFDINTKKLVIFEISRRKNDVYALVKHIREGGITYGVSFNGLAFDAQVIQFILDNYKRWYDFDGDRICKIIYKFSQKVIDDTKYNLFPPYREEALEFKQLDLFRIHHYDNEARRTSWTISLAKYKPI